MSENYYHLLGVDQSASPAEIKKAFRKKAMELHPDRNPGNQEVEEQFKKVQGAYSVLSDEKKRSMYDQLGHDQFEHMQSGGGGGNPGGGFGSQHAGFDGAGFDFFESIFSNFRGGEEAQQQRQGKSLRLSMTITLEDAFHGIEKELSIEALVPCTGCDGSGSVDKKVTACTACGGAGQTRVQRGFMVFSQTCGACHGQGRKIKNPCKPCKGQGALFGQRRIRVHIPAGIEDDVQMRLAGQGHAGVQGAPPGDVFVHIRIKDHDLFLRQDDMILCRAPISMIQAALGGTVELPTIDGKRVSVTIPAGSQTDDKLRLKEHGFVRYKARGRGDMYVQLMVEIPRKLTQKQKELLEAFGEESQDSVHQPQTNSFFKKVSSFLRYGHKETR